MAEGPGCPSYLCHSMAVALCGGRLDRFMRTWKDDAGVVVCLIIHCLQRSRTMVIVVLFYYHRLVGSSLLSHHIPCLLRSLNDTRLQRKSGHQATLLRCIDCLPLVPCVMSLTTLYPLIQTLELPAQIQSPITGGRMSSSFERLLHMCIVELESRMNTSFSGYPCLLALNAAFIMPLLMLEISLPCSHSLTVSGVCEVLI